MSDPMTKVEIEDVLSSIRRLVSEDLNVPQGSDSGRPSTPHGRPMLSAAPAARPAIEPETEEALDTSFFDQVEAGPQTSEGDAGEPAAEEVQPDPLVLTPALRVAGADSASLRASLEETIAELEAAISGSGDEWEPDGSEMPGGAVDFRELEPGLALTGDALDAEVETVAGIADEDLEEVIAELEVARPLAEAAIEPREAENPLRLVSDSGDARPEGLWSQYPETMEWAAPGELTGDETPEVGADLEPQEDEPLDLSPEEPEPLPGPEPGLDDQADADVTERFWAAEAEDTDFAAAPDPVDDMSRSTPEAAPDWQDASVEDGKPRRLHLAGGLGWGPQPPISGAGRGWVRGEPEDTDTLEAEEDDEDGMFDDVEDAVIDEAALRALVSEIIRQELQGTLGERITRSVRKLVRREIQRALASRDFE